MAGTKIASPVAQEILSYGIINSTVSPHHETKLILLIKGLKIASSRRDKICGTFSFLNDLTS